MNTKPKIVIMLLFLAFTLFAAGSALTGCAGNLRPPREVHKLVKVTGMTKVVTGPAVGHWEEDRGQTLLAYTVYGNDCTKLSRQASVEIDRRGSFDLPQGRSLCMETLQEPPQYVQLHARRP